MLRRTLLIALSMVAPSCARSQETGFRQTSVSLYSPVFAWERDGPPAKVIAEYVLSLSARAKEVLQTRPAVNASGSLVVALKPPKQSRVWVVTGEQAKTDILQAALAGPLGEVPPPTVRGVLAFALDFDAGAGGVQPNRLEGVIAVPEEWANALSDKGGRIPDDALSVVWP